MLRRALDSLPRPAASLRSGCLTRTQSLVRVSGAGSLPRHSSSTAAAPGASSHPAHPHSHNPTALPHAHSPKGFPPSYYVLPTLTPKVQELLQGYYEVVPIQVAWGDMDTFAHVNNTKYPAWCEVARIHWMTQLARAPIGGEEQAKLFPSLLSHMSGQGVGPILRSLHYDFRSPVTYPDCVLVGSRVHALGADRFSLTHRLVSCRQERIVGDAEGIIVSFSYADNQKADIPPIIRKAIETRIRQQAQVEIERPLIKPPRATLNFDETMGGMADSK